MLVYIYAADLFCSDCGEAIRQQLTRAGMAPEAPDDQRSYDSGEFPKRPYPDGGGESDLPQHCGAGADCMNAIEFPDGCRVGAWLENELTADGVEYVREAIREGGEVAELWAEFYCDYEL
ncbi:MAG: hypothetical protein DWQ31_17130 [Planctomycetota bacterium]|nr:MAG: hypothetical protein DWQ31_17130 [Planctomycetota bacterium]REJ92078.1 MAG: hypothetical protein DWQ35_13080 [Planctomycetota bacterium]REK28614.1 MAG: hypothetical protein DWQ42_04670 [Planctomycetota bacterium]REK39228.1 MAG: hypothetical protein DWQ46_18250 [Planctomycetota bacterium]